MPRIEITDDHLVVHVQGVDRVLSFTGTLSIPLAHVSGIEHDPSAVSNTDPGLRMRGTRVPGLVTAGSYLRPGEWSF